MEERNLRKVMIGTVTSNKMDKTIVVSVETSVKHPLYGKIVKRTYKLKAHDENNSCEMGDKVKVMETRPLSKDKRWRVVEILEKGEYEVIVASRAKHREGYERYTSIRNLASKIYIKVINLFGGIKISDAQCGFKGFDGDIARNIFSYCKTNNFAFDLEVILIAQKMKLKIFELPAKIINHRESKVNVVKDAIRMLKEISRIKKNVRKIDI